MKLAVCVLLLSVAAVSAFIVAPVPTSRVAARPGATETRVNGRGDVGTKKGKRFRHTYGKCRPRKPTKATADAEPEALKHNAQNLEELLDFYTPKAADLGDDLGFGTEDEYPDMESPELNLDNFM